MAYLNKLRRQDHTTNLVTAFTYRRAGMPAEARKFLAYARFDRSCFVRAGWRLP